jgi:hypothetical protein
MAKPGAGWLTTLMLAVALPVYVFGRAYDFISLEVAGLYGVGVAGVEALHIGVEGGDQLLVGDAVGGRVEPRGGDDGLMHESPRLERRRPGRAAFLNPRKRWRHPRSVAADFA